MTTKKHLRALIAPALLTLVIVTAGCAGVSSPARKASVPALEFAGQTDPAAIWEPGDSIAPSSYDVFMTGSRVIEARWTADDVTGHDALELRLDDEGSERLEEWTGSHVGEQLLFVLDGTVIVAPVVQSTITDGRLLIPVNDDVLRDRLDGALQPLE